MTISFFMNLIVNYATGWPIDVGLGVNGQQFKI